METAINKTLPLKKGSTSYKIIIPEEVERAIRFLCERVWDTEWSGVLFYVPSGNFEDGSLEVKCVDILPMDVGSQAYTEFTMSPDVISYMAENPNLLDCKMGLIHSHNNMATFFSGTDLSTLEEEGRERNHFVSLIVNNAGKYTAAITRHVKYKAIRTLSYEGFDGTVTPDKSEEICGEEIEYFNLEIVMDGYRDNYTQNLADRISEIKKKKSTSVSTSFGSYKDNKEPDTFSYNPYKVAESFHSTMSKFDDKDDEPTLFDDIGWKSTATTAKSKKVVSKESIDSIVNQLITGSVVVLKLDAPVREKLIKSIDIRFDSRFGKGNEGLLLFESWAQDFIYFLFWSSIEDYIGDDMEESVELAEAVIDALNMLPDSKYIDKYVELITDYVNRF